MATDILRYLRQQRQRIVDITIQPGGTSTVVHVKSEQPLADDPTQTSEYERIKRFETPDPEALISFLSQEGISYRDERRSSGEAKLNATEMNRLYGLGYSATDVIHMQQGEARAALSSGRQAPAQLPPQPASPQRITGPRPMPVQQSAQSSGVGSDYEQFLTWGLNTGHTAEEIRKDFPSLPGATLAQSKRQLAEFYAPGWLGHEAKERRAGRSAMPMSQWVRTPEFQRQKHLLGAHIDDWEQGDYGPIPPEGHLYEGKGKHAYPVGVLDATYLGKTEGGYVTTAKPGSEAKRLQQLGKHEQLIVQGLPVVRDPLPAGPLHGGTVSTQTYQPVRMAVVLGGEVSASGQHFIEESLGPVEGLRKVVNVFGEGAEPVKVGQQWGVGQPVQLGPGLEPIQSPHWGHRVRDVRPIAHPEKGEGARVVLERTAPISEVSVGLKEAYKGQALATNLAETVTFASGAEPPQYIATQKDWLGTAYTFFKGEFGQASPERQRELLAELGVSKLPESYSELARPVLERFRARAEQMVDTMYWQRRVHEAQLPLYQGVMVGNPREVEGMPYMRDITAQYQVLRGTAGVSFMWEPHPTRGRLSYGEMQSLQAMQPEVAERYRRAGAGRQRAHQNVINAALYSTGKYAIPQQVLRGSELGGRMLPLLAEAESAVRLMTGAGVTEAIPQRMVARQFMERLGYGMPYNELLQQAAGGASVAQLKTLMAQGEELSKTPIMFEGGGEQLIIPPGESLKYTSATGAEQGEEVSKYHTAIFGLAQRVMSGEEIPKEQIVAARDIQRQLAESKKWTRRAMGTEPGREYVTGAKVAVSEALAPNEVLNPRSPEGETGQVVRYPTMGKASYDPGAQVVNIGMEEGLARKMNVERLTVSPQIQQASQGDADGDIDWYLKTGQAIKIDGKYFDASGKELSAGTIKALSRRAVEQGAANIMDEYVGVGAPSPSRQEAIEMVKRGAVGRVVSDEEMLAKTKERAENVGNIGRVYNIPQRMAATAPDPAAVASAEKLLQLAYGPAQRPGAPPEQVLAALDLATITAKGGTHRMYAKQGEDPYGRPTTIRNLPGVMWAATQVAAGLVSVPKGQARMTAPEAAAGLAPLGKRKQIISALARAKKGGLSAAPMVFRELIKAYGGNPADAAQAFAQESSWGTFYGGQWAKSVKKSAEEAGIDVWQSFQEKGVPREVAEHLLGGREQQDAAIRMMAKGGDIEEWVESVRASGRELPWDLPERLQTQQVLSPVSVGNRGTPTKEEYETALASFIASSDEEEPALKDTIDRYRRAHPGGGTSDVPGAGMAPPTSTPPGGRKPPSPPVTTAAPPVPPSGGRAPSQQPVQQIQNITQHITQATQFKRPVFRQRHSEELGLLMQEANVFLANQKEIVGGRGALTKQQGAAMRRLSQVTKRMGTLLNYEDKSSFFAPQMAEAEEMLMQGLQPAYQAMRLRDTSTVFEAAITPFPEVGPGAMQWFNEMATEESLQTIQGVGPKTAYRAVTKRNMEGLYGKQITDVRQLEAMRGIGPATSRRMAEGLPGAAGQDIGNLTQQLSEGVRLMGDDLTRAHKAIRILADDPQLQEYAKRFAPALKGIVEALEPTAQEARTWARGVLRGHRGTLEGLEAAGKAGPLDKPQQQQLAALTKIAGMAQPAMAMGEGGGILGRLGAIDTQQARTELELQAAGGAATGGRGRAARGLMGDFLSEFSIGGAAIRMAVVSRYTKGVVGGWEQAAEPYEMAGMQFGLAYGQSYEDVMQGSMGQMMQYQAAQRSFQMGLGTSALQQRAGFLGMMGVEPTFQMGQALGGVGGPLLSGLGAGLTTGIAATTAGSLLTAGGVGFGATVTAAAAPLALGVGGLVATGAMAGQSYAASDLPSLQREYAEIQAGEREKPSLWSRVGYGFRQLFSEGGVEALITGDQEKGGYGKEVQAGLAAYKQSAQFQIDTASITLENLDKLNLDPAQARELGVLLSLGGYTPEQISGGQAQQAINRLAPMAQLGQAGAYTSSIERFAGYLGIAPGKGIQPFLTELPTQAQPAEQAQWMMAAQLLGSAGGQAGITPGLGMVEQYADWLGSGVSTTQLNLAARERMGLGGIGQTLGVPAGFSSAFAKMLEPSTAGFSARPATPGDVGGLPGMPVYDQPVYGSAQLSAEQYMKMQSLTQFGMSQQGYNMMAGGYGLGSGLSALFNAYEEGPGAPTGPALMDQYGYSYGQMERRALNRQQLGLSRRQTQASWEYQQTQNQFQMGTGEWGGQSSVGWGFGMTGQIQIQQDLMEFTKAIRAITHQMTDLQRQQTMKGIEFQERGLELSTRQSLENLGMSRRTWQEGIQFQRVQMGVQFGQMETQQGWQMQDMAYNRQMAGFQHEYQQDELERSIRLSTGREKQGLLRRREYQEEMYSRTEDRRGVEEERAKQVMEWERQKFSLQKEHFERTTQLQEMQFRMQERHILERYALEKEQIEQRKKDYTAIWALEDERRKLQEAWEDRQQQYQLEELQRQKKYYEEVVFPYQQKQHDFQLEGLALQEKGMKLQEGIEDAHAKYMAWQIKQYSAGGDLYDRVMAFIDEILAKLGSGPTAADEQTWSETPPEIPGYNAPYPNKQASSNDLAAALFAGLQGASMKLVLDDGKTFDAHIETVQESADFRRKQAGSWGVPWK